ncbi:hypothetical protein AgCh_009776 [Apium graveolens]
MAENPNQKPHQNNPQMSLTEPINVTICRNPELTNENFTETELSLHPEFKVSDFIDDQVNNGTNMFNRVNDDNGGEILGSDLELGFSDDDFETNSWLSTDEYDEWDSNIYVYYLSEFSGYEVFDEGLYVGAEYFELDDDAYYIGEHDMMFEEYLLESGAYETPTAIYVIEDLASSIITQENIENNHVTCVVCLKEFGIGETLKVKDSDEVYDPGIDLGYFTGLGNIDDFVEWVTQVDKISAYTGWTEMRIFKIAALKLTKKAGLWFDNLNIKRVRSGKEKIMTWTSLKKKLRAKYIPLHYKFECIMKMTSLSQGTMSVSEYTSEFYRLRLICDLEETETIKIGRFIRGLNLPIYRKVKSSPYISFNDVCNLALEFESFQHDEKLKSSLHEFTLSEETKEEDFVSVENVADLVADYHVLHVATTSSLEEKDEPVTKEAMVEKHEERQSLDDKFLVVEENQIDTSLKLVCRDMVEEKKVLEDMFQTKEVVYKENNIIIVEHNDFLGVENLLNSPISSNYLILSSLLPKILLMELKFKAFKFYEKSPRYVLILKYFRTRGRVFFKGEENDEDQGMNMLIWIWLCVLVVMFNWRGCKHGLCSILGQQGIKERCMKLDK